MKRTDLFPTGMLIFLALLSFGCAATTTAAPPADYPADGHRIPSAGVWATPWMHSVADDPGWYIAFSLWVVDDNGRSGTNIAVGPFVVKGKGVVPKAHW